MNIKKTLWLVLGLLVVSSMLLAACGPAATEAPVEPEAPAEPAEPAEPAPEPEPSPEPEPAGPVTTYGASTTDIPTLDPQLGEDVVSIDYIENLFVHLTNYDAITAEIVPEAATSWDISEDGLTYTFTLRTDIPWVYHNPVTDETTQVVDEEGNPRFVTAFDFEYGIKRACDPNLAAYYSSVIAPNIVGCEDVLYYEDPENVPAELYDAIGASAVDATTLVITLPFPAAYFLSMTPMWVVAASPQWAIDEHGASWIEAGNIVTNGRYVLHEWVHGVRRILKRNPSCPPIWLVPVMLKSLLPMLFLTPPPNTLFG